MTNDSERSEQSALGSPKWDSSETAEMDDEFQEIKNPLLASIFHWTMIVLLLAIIFGVSGSAFLFLILRISHQAAMYGTNDFAIGAFIFGGILGVVGAVGVCFKQDY